MSANPVEFSLTCDNRDAVEAIEKTAELVQKLFTNARKGSGALSSAGGRAGKSFSSAAAAARSIGKGVQSAEAPVSRLSRATAGLKKGFAAAGAAAKKAAGSIKTAAAGMSKALATVGGALAAGATAAGGLAISAAGKRDSATAQIAAIAGGGEQGKAAADWAESQMVAFGAKAGLDPSTMLAQVASLQKAGMSVQDSVAAVSQAWILAGRDEARATQIVEKFAETAAAVGESVDPMIGTMEGLGIDVRSVLAEMKGMSVAELAEAAAKGQVSVADMVEATRRLSSEGTVHFAAFEAAAGSYEGRMAALQVQLRETLVPLGESLMPAVIKAFAALQNAMPSIASLTESVAGAIGWLASALADGVRRIEEIFLGLKNTLRSISRGSFDISGSFAEAHRTLRDRDLAARAAARERKNKPALPPPPAVAGPAVTPATAPAVAKAAASAAGLGEVLRDAGAPASRSKWTPVLIQDSLAAIGGGGRRLSFAEVQGQALARKTASASEETARNTGKLVSLMQSPSACVLA